MPLISAGQFHVWYGTERTWRPSDLLSWDLTNNRLGIGTNSPVYLLHVNNAGTDPGTHPGQYDVLIDSTRTNNDSFRQYALRVATVMNGNGTGVPVNYAIYGQILTGTSGASGNLTGVRGLVAANGSASIQQAVGVGAGIGVNYLSGTVNIFPNASFSTIGVDVDTLEIGGAVSVNMNGGITAGIRILAPFNSGSGETITGYALVGLYIQDMYSSIGSWSLAKPWGIFAAGGTQFLGGNVSMFNSDPGFNTERGVLFIGNASVAPSGPFASGFTCYVASAKLVCMRDVTVPDDAYSASGWNGNNDVATKNAIRDKIETLQPLNSVGTYKWDGWSPSNLAGTNTNAPSTGTSDVDSSFYTVSNSSGTLTITFVKAGRYLVNFCMQARHANAYDYDNGSTAAYGGTVTEFSSGNGFQFWGEQDNDGDWNSSDQFMVIATAGQTLTILPKYRVSAGVGATSDHTAKAKVTMLGPF